MSPHRWASLKIQPKKLQEMKYIRNKADKANSYHKRVLLLVSNENSTKTIHYWVLHPSVSNVNMGSVNYLLHTGY